MESKSRLLDFSWIKEKLFGKNGTMILLVIGFVGIGLIVLSEVLPSSSGSKSSSADTSASTSEFAKNVQKQLTGIIGTIEGVGRVNVMVTVDSGVQYVYEQDEKTTSDKTVSQSQESTQTQENSDSETNPVVIDNGNGGQKPLVKTELQPTVRGVVVVCDGGDDPVVQERIINTVTTALGIESDSVTVCKMAGK